MKKTVNKVDDLLLTKHQLSIESCTDEPYQLPIENQTLLESLELHLADETFGNYCYIYYVNNVLRLSGFLFIVGSAIIRLWGYTHKSVMLLMKKLFSREVAMLYS